jgi:hypothetical protein
VIPVQYEHEFPYPYDEDGRRYPRLTVRVLNAANPTRGAIDVDAYLDSGAERSLFDGAIGRVIGIDLLSGEQKRYESTIGSSIPATLHAVRLEHLDVGAFELTVGFSSSRIKRNLLGRDFFNLAQIGFREHHLAFFITPRP